MYDSKNYDAWRKSFIDIYSATPYQYTLNENADHLFSYWELSWNYYMDINPINPIQLFNLLSTMFYIQLSIIIHLLILSFILPVAAIFLNYDENILTTLGNWIKDSLIAIQSIHFSLLDLIVQPVLFALSLLCSPITFFKPFFTEHSHDPVLGR
ncbi:MAG: hypothetical protein EBQ95_06760 [Gammaproteobacteria bacterium]|nr:hypothetical protein [Gammaproteobacteria bacterium]